MDFSGLYCGNHFIKYVSQTIILYALNFYCDVCQLFFNKTMGEKDEERDSLNAVISPRGCMAKGMDDAAETKSQRQR